jgi:hypothetical protein
MLLTNLQRGIHFKMSGRIQDAINSFVTLAWPYKALIFMSHTMMLLFAGIEPTMAHMHPPALLGKNFLKYFRIVVPF